MQGYSNEGDDRTGDAPQEPRPRPVRGGAAQHDPDPLQRPHRGERGRRHPADGDRSRPPDQRDGRGQRHPAGRDHRLRPHPVRHRPQAARGQPGRARPPPRARCRSMPAAPASTSPTLPRDDFPVIAEGELPTRFELPAATLRQIIDKTRFAISTEETRYYLNGIFLHVSDEAQPVLKAAATDGHRLARVTVPRPGRRRGHARRDHPAQMRRRAAQAARRGRRHRPGLAVRDPRSASGSAPRS